MKKVDKFNLLSQNGYKPNMPKSEKATKTRIKVEEIEDNEPDKLSPVNTAPAEDSVPPQPELNESSKKPEAELSEKPDLPTEPPKVTSFSQLDMKKSPEVSVTKKSILEP